jgi:hypothetical protein
MLLDDYVLEELGHGAGTVNQIKERLLGAFSIP